VTRIYSDEAELYDIAFGWDLSEEADWLVQRLGPSCRSVLEPGCGSGRMLEALAARGLEVVGLDLSEPMVAYARARLRQAGVKADVVHADMTSFDLGRRFDGAVSPVSTVGLLGREGFAAHLEAMARHLEPASRYLVQQGVSAPEAELWRSEWEAERDGVKLHVVWEAFERDPAVFSERSRSRVEILAGSRAGEVVEDVHTNTFWTVDAWREAVAASPFAEVACYDGAEPARPAVELERGGGLLWHELVTP
jgi:cyclopropane fatty-acyl-phospholipid synthase-like methyltransferase